MAASHSLFADYSFLSLPNLSTLRHPPRSRETTSIPVHPRSTEKALLVALARCLGSYCSSNDVLIGWNQPHTSTSANNRALTAARVSWEASATWEHLQQNIALKDTEDDPASIRRDLELQLDAGQSPFLAIVSTDIGYDHSLVVSLGSDESGQTNTLHLAYSTLLFHASTAGLLAAQLRDVLAHILEHPSSDPKSLAFLPRELQSAVPLRADGPYYTHIPEPRTVPDFLLRHDPSKNALEYYPDLYEDDAGALERTVQRLTYGELHARSNRFAAYLCAQGLELEDRVALCLPRGIEFHIAMLGVFKAGGCYVPIDAELPEERQKFIASDSGARFVLTEENIQSHLADSEAFPADDINNAQSDGLAYLLYTSGTTGTPKGCLLTHDGFAQAIHALSWFPTGASPGKSPKPEGGRYLAIASVAFDVHLSETFVSMALGMTLISAPRSQLLEDLPQWLSRLRISHVGIVPSLIEATMHAVAESAEQSTNESEDVDGQNQAMELVYIASGGEKMSDNILDKWADHPSVNLANFYGPSEVTIGCSGRFMTSRTRKESIGRIFENCSAYVVNENLEMVIRGGVGELLVGGRLVGRGYHGRPDLTEKAFIDWQGERVYRTGDLVRLMPDDTLEIMGRIDTQIKLRGVRIESEGVSSVVRNAAINFPGLKSRGVADVSTVLARHPHLQTDQLVSFISWDSSIPVGHRRSAKPRVLTSAPSGLMRALRDACSRELASYMRPAHIVPLDFLPLNPNGKADGKALVALFQGESLEVLGRAGAQKDENGDASGGKPTPGRPLNEEEARIADIVAHFTAVPREQLIPSSNFFELGLDSLKIVRLASELRSVLSLGSVASVGNLVQHPTIEEIATLTSERGSKSVEAPRDSYVTTFATQWRQEIEETVGQEKVESVLPTFPVQDGVLYRSADLNTLYVQHVVLKIHEDVNAEKLKNTWTTLMSRHEILRTVFHFSSALVQVVLRSESCELPWQERTIKADDVDSFSSHFVGGDALEFARNINENVSIVPPFRLVLHRGEESATRFLTLSIHHAIYDGISLPLLLKDAEMLYLDFDEELRSSTPLAEVLDSIYDVDVDAAGSFWNKLFDGFDWSKVPRLLASGETANTHSVPFTKGSLREWETMAAEAKVSMQALLTAAFGVCLGNHLYGNSDVVFGVIRSGRSFAEERLNNAQAPLLSVLPTRVNAIGDSDVLATVQRNIGGVLAFEHTPLSRVQQWLQPGKSLFEALLSVSIDEGAEPKIWDVLHSSQPQADYILAVEIVLNQKTGEIRVDCAYTDPLSKDLIIRLLADIEATAFTLAEGSHVASPGVPAVLPSGENAEDEDEDEDELPDGSIDYELEERIQALVSRFLKIEKNQVSTTSSLFALGLDSIKSVGLTRALKKEGFKITALELMRRPFIRHIAACQIKNAEVATNVEAEEEDLLKSSRADIAKHVDKTFAVLNEADKVELYPVTVLQAGMLSQTVNSGGHLYVHAFPFKLSKTIEIERLKRAWQSAVQHFSTLRTSFHFLEEKGSWIQAIHSDVELKWSEVDSPVEESMATSMENYIASINFSSEATFASPPVYLRLYRGTRESAISAHTLVLVMHHALYDGIAISRLTDVLDAFYRSEEPAPSPRFVDLMGYFAYQERHGTGYWIKQLQGLKRPALTQNASASESSSTSTSFEIPLTSTRLGEACKLFDATVQCFGQAALAKILAKLYNSRDILFGHVVSGRNVAQAEDVLGPMISTLPCRVRIPQGLKNLDLVRSIHGQNLSAQKWQHASLRSIQRKLELNSLWDSIFVFQPIMDDPSDKKDTLWQFDDSEDEIAKIQYPLNIELHQHADHLVIKAACQSNILSETNLNDILRQFSDEIISVIDKPSNIALPELSTEGVRLNCNGETASPQIGHMNGSADPESDESDSQTSSFIEILAASTNVPVENIKLDTPLVSLGVDSISAIQISSKARQAGLNLRAADVLRCQRPLDVLNILKKKGSKLAPKAHQVPDLSSETKRSILRALDVSFDAIEMILPASAGMKWLIGMWQLSDRSRFQHAFAFGLPSDVDEGKLKTAWSSLVKEHPILRSTFASTNASDVHIVTFKELPKERFWSSRDISDDRPADQAISGILKDLVSSPLSTDLPPIQAVFLRCHRSNYFVLNLHHFQYDAWSLRLLINDLRHLYLGEKTVSSGSLTSLLHNCSSPSYKEEQKQYWLSYLPTPFTPSLYPSNSAEKERDRLVYIDRKAIRNVPALRRRAQALSLSLNAVFLACWARVQADYSKASSATFGLWHLGRSGVVDDIASVAVPSMNVLPIHVNTVQPGLQKLSSQLQTMLRQRSAIVEQSYLEDVNHWCGGNDKRSMLNVFVNIVATAELEEDGFESLLSPINMPYYIPKIVEAEARPTAGRLAICDLIEEAILIDFVAIGQNVTVSVEYAGNYLDTDTCRELITTWAQLVKKTLNE